MSPAELASSLHALPRSDKLMALQLLSADLASEEEIPLNSGAAYPINTPEATPGAEDVLLQLLKEDAVG